MPKHSSLNTEQLHSEPCKVTFTVNKPIYEY